MPLTMENSGAALVCGAPLPKKVRTVRVLRAFMFDGEPLPAGAQVLLPALFAAEMVGAGKAAYAADAAPAAMAPAPTTTTRAAKATKE